MGATDRLMTLLRSNINDRIDRAQDPGKMLDQIVLEMKQQLMEAKKLVCVAIADERALRHRADHYVAEASAWERRAMLAVRAGHDDLARAALVRKAEQDELAQTYGAQWSDQKRAVDNLRSALAGLSQKIGDASRQRTVLVARAARAHAQRTINATLASLDGTSPWGTLERMEERVVQLESEVDAAAELGDSHVVSLEAQFRALEAGNIDDELAALKRRMALPGVAAPRALGQSAS